MNRQNSSTLDFSLKLTKYMLKEFVNLLAVIPQEAEAIGKLQTLF